MQRTRSLALTVSLALTAGVAGVAAADDLDGEAIVRHTDADHRSDDEIGVVDMAVIDRRGRKQRRKLKLMFKGGADDNDKSMLQFLEPETLRGLALLTHEASGRSDDQWIYVKELHKAKKIASSDRTNRFAQTDFTYEDLRTEDFDAHTYERQDDADLDGVACYVVEARPKEDTNSGYSRRVVWVSKDHFLIHQVEYYDTKGRHQKTLRNLGFEQVEGLWRPTRSVMVDHQRGSKTLWQFTDRKINPGLSDNLFTVANLERGL